MIQSIPFLIQPNKVNLTFNFDYKHKKDVPTSIKIIMLIYDYKLRNKLSPKILIITVID